jgi:hypothetical protein
LEAPPEQQRADCPQFNLHDDWTTETMSKSLGDLEASQSALQYPTTQIPSLTIDVLQSLKELEPIDHPAQNLTHRTPESQEIGTSPNSSLLACEDPVSRPSQQEDGELPHPEALIIPETQPS